MSHDKSLLGIFLISSLSGINDSSIYSHLNTTQHSFEDKNIVILDKEHNWFERGVKEVTYLRMEIPH